MVKKLEIITFAIVFGYVIYLSVSHVNSSMSQSYDERLAQLKTIEIGYLSNPFYAKEMIDARLVIETNSTVGVTVSLLEKAITCVANRMESRWVPASKGHAPEIVCTTRGHPVVPHL